MEKDISTPSTSFTSSFSFSPSSATPSIITIRIIFNITTTIFTNSAIRNIIFKDFFNNNKIIKYFELFEEKVRIYKFGSNE